MCKKIHDDLQENVTHDHSARKSVLTYTTTGRTQLIELKKVNKLVTSFGM